MSIIIFNIISQMNNIKTRLEADYNEIVDES